MTDFIEFGALNVPVTIEFRDGARDVPDYFARLLSASGIDFHAVTFEEATALIATIHTRNYLNGVVSGVISTHRKSIG